MAKIISERVEPEEEIKENEDVFNEEIAGIVARCSAASIEVATVEGMLYDHEYNIKIPQGRGAREVNLWSAQGAYDFSHVAFEEYRYVAGFTAIYSQTHDIIEVMVEPLNRMSATALQVRLFGTDRAKLRRGEKSYRLRLNDGERSIEIGSPSAVLKAFSANPSTGFSMQLRGYGAETHDDALRLLNRIFDSLTFQIDLATGIPLGLVRDRQNKRSEKTISESAAAVKAMDYPSHEYDHAPISLYQYGRSAVGMPLLQFLAFYQVVEFYYPTYSNSDARRRVRNILKDPIFRAERDADIGRIIAIMRSGSGGIGSERAQMKAAIRECVDASLAREFIQATPARSEHFSSKPKRPTHTRISLSDPKGDILGEIGDRLYNIRCEIVHTKDQGEDEQNVQRLLPFTAEAEQIDHDIELMRYVAQRVLIASSTTLQ